MISKINAMGRIKEFITIQKKMENGGVLYVGTLSKEKQFIKYVRAKAKTRYHKLKKDKCWVCGSDKDLELHHVYPLSDLVWGYLKENNITNPENTPELRDKILEDLQEKIFGEDNLLTICKVHHKNLHRLFGRTYNSKMVQKVKKYLTKQKEKLNG